MDATLEKPRLALLLKHFGRLTDPRHQWRVAPMPEVLLLAVCGTISSCDDYDEIVEWGETHLAFLRRFRPIITAFRAPTGRALMNRIDPAQFQACFTAWVRECWPDQPDLFALDGKRAALNLVSAFATSERLLAPFDDLVIIVAAADGTAHRQEQHLRHRSDAPLMARVGQPSKMLQKEGKAGLLEGGIHRAGSESARSPSES
jgi:hypothetical protein